MTPTQPTAEQLRLAQECACQAVEVYGEGDAREHDAAVLRTLWNDHPAVQSALLAIQATEARMASAVEVPEEIVELIEEFRRISNRQEMRQNLIGTHNNFYKTFVDPAIAALDRHILKGGA